MKNIEKYANTKDALDAYNSLNIKKLPFEEWLKCEYEEPSVPSLLEAANAVVKAWYAKMPEGSIARVGQSIFSLSSAIEREKRKPLRNCDRPECTTSKAAQDVWRKEDGGKTAYYEWLLAPHHRPCGHGGERPGGRARADDRAQVRA